MTFVAETSLGSSCFGHAPNLCVITHCKRLRKQGEHLHVQVFVCNTAVAFATNGGLAVGIVTQACAVTYGGFRRTQS